MKNFLLLTVLVLSSLYYGEANAQVAFQVDASAPNGVEVGAGYQLGDNFGVGLNYGYLHFADAVNFQVRAGLKNIYAFGTINLINANQRGRQAIADAVNQIIAEQASKDVESEKALSGLSFAQSDFRITDLGIGGGIGVKFGPVFMEAGLRTSRVRAIADEKLDRFVNRLQSHVDQDPTLTPVEKQLVQGQLDDMRTETKNSLQQGFQSIPGELKFLPEVRLGLRFILK